MHRAGLKKQCERNFFSSHPKQNRSLRIYWTDILYPLGIKRRDRNGIYGHGTRNTKTRRKRRMLVGRQR